jgi:hypothetical protein
VKLLKNSSSSSWLSFHQNDSCQIPSSYLSQINLTLFHFLLLFFILAPFFIFLRHFPPARSLCQGNSLPREISCKSSTPNGPLQRKPKALGPFDSKPYHCHSSTNGILFPLSHSFFFLFFLFFLFCFSFFSLF